VLGVRRDPEIKKNGPIYFPLVEECGHSLDLVKYFRLDTRKGVSEKTFWQLACSSLVVSHDHMCKIAYQITESSRLFLLSHFPQKLCRTVASVNQYKIVAIRS